MNEELIVTFHGVKVITVPDNTLKEIILPQTALNYILKLQEENAKYKKQKLMSIFKTNI